MSPRPSEVRAFVELLDQEHDDIQELAKVLIDKLEELRSESLQWDVIVQRGAGEHLAAVSTYGPYSTQNAALGAIEGGLVALSKGDQWMLAPSGTAEYLERLKVRTDIHQALLPSSMAMRFDPDKGEYVHTKEQIKALARALNCTQKFALEVLEVAEVKRRPASDYVKLIIDTTRELKRAG